MTDEPIDLTHEMIHNAVDEIERLRRELAAWKSAAVAGSHHELTALRQRDALRAERDAYKARIDAALAEHTVYEDTDGGHWCNECLAQSWPCPTVRALTEDAS